MVAAKRFFFFLRRMATQWNRKETQSGHVREMINSELHYWKASLIRCSRLPGEPAQNCRLGLHCCFFHYQKFPHNTMAEKTTPLGAPMQENGCFKNTYEAYNECWELATDSVFVLSIKKRVRPKEGQRITMGFTAILLPWSFRFTKLVRQNDIYAFGCMRTHIRLWVYENTDIRISKNQ